MEGYRIKDGIAYISSKHKEQNALLELKLKLKSTNLSNEVLEYKWEDYIGNISKANIDKLKKVLDFLNSENKFFFKNAIYYFYGPNGTQKTHTSKTFALELLKKGFSVYFTSMQNLLRDLTDLDSNNDEESEVFNRISLAKEADFLFLDESFDKSKVTMFKSGFQLPFLDSFIRDKIQEGKAIIFISNINYTNIEEFAGKSIFDFIYRNIKLKNSSLYFEDNYIYTLENCNDEKIQLSIF